MNAIRVRKRIESDTLQIPELKSFVGRTVEIIIFEETPTVIPGTGDWEAAEKAIQELEDYDFEAYRRQRECDLEHARDHLP